MLHHRICRRAFSRRSFVFLGVGLGGYLHQHFRSPLVFCSTLSPVTLDAHPAVPFILDDRPQEFKEFSFWSKLYLFFRCIKLFILYLPSIISLPFALIFPGSIGELTWQYTFWAINKSGPVFVKFAQWIATRPDLFPETLVSRFSNFHSSVPVHSWKETQHTLDRTFPNWEEALEIIDRDNPLGSGCMTQVYKARLKTMDPNPIVAVKVMHPHVREHLEADVDLIEFVYRCFTSIPIISPYFKWCGFDLSMREFRQIMTAQTDLRMEARNLHKFSKNFSKQKHVHFPKVFHATEDILIESFEEGVEISEYYSEPEPVRKELAKLGLNAFLQMLFEDNFFHSDLHPGNILVRRDKNGKLNIIFIDCGIARSYSQQDMRNFQDLFLAIVQGDGEKAGKLIYERSPSVECEDPDKFCKDVKQLIDSVELINLKLAYVGHIMSTIIQICKTHKVQLDGNFSSVVIAVLILEGVGRNLDGDISILRVLTQHLLSKVSEPSIIGKLKSFFSREKD